MELRNLKFLEDDDYILEADPIEVRNFITETENKANQFTRVESNISSASCRFDEIECFMFGGFSSRFWALRKHINCLKDE